MVSNTPWLTARSSKTLRTPPPPSTNLFNPLSDLPEIDMEEYYDDDLPETTCEEPGLLISYIDSCIRYIKGKAP